MADREAVEVFAMELSGGDDWTHHGDLKQLKRSWLRGNKLAPYHVLRYCLAEKKAIPVWAVKAVMADGFTHYDPESSQYEAWLERVRHNAMCFALVRELRKEHKWEVALGLAAETLRVTRHSVKSSYFEAKRGNVFHSKVRIKSRLSTPAII